MTSIRDTRRIQFAAVGIAFAVFSAIYLLVLFLTPSQNRGAALLPALLSGVAVIVILPFLLSVFEQQEARIERQATEIETLHAMDAAIFSEMELPRLLPVAADKSLIACDADATGVVLFHPDSRKLVSEAYRMPDVAGEAAQARFMSLVRGGSANGDDDWETLVAPLMAATPGNADRAIGYMLVARRRVNTRSFSPSERRLLDALAGTVRIAVTNAGALAAAREAQAVREELKATQESQRRDRAVARALTEGLLPEIPERIGEWNFSQRYEAQSDEAPVGGDLYDLFRIAPGKWGVFIADVSGKGLAAARRIALVKYALRSYAREHPSPADVLTHLNETLFDEPELTGFVTLFYAVLDERAAEVRWSSAGHETPVLRRANGECETLFPTGPVLGAMNDVVYTEDTLHFRPGDGLLLFTDGLSEARAPGEPRRMLEIKGIERELGTICDALPDKRGPASVADAMMGALHQFTEGNLSDDTALLWMQYTPDYAHGLPPK